MDNEWENETFRPRPGYTDRLRTLRTGSVPRAGDDAFVIPVVGGERRSASEGDVDCGVYVGESTHTPPSRRSEGLGIERGDIASLRARVYGGDGAIGVGDWFRLRRLSR